MQADRVALITGITGQDGSYLAEFLLSKGYHVHGIVRRSSDFNTARIDHIYNPDDAGRRLFLHYGDLSDSAMLSRILDDVQPDELYNLGAQSHVGISFEMPEYTTDVTAVGPLRLMEAVRMSGRPIRMYQASSSEMFGDALPPQSEGTAFDPNSPYATAKAFAHNMARVYRDAYQVFVACGILFNHESPRRGSNFVTRKISRRVARIVSGRAAQLHLGNLAAKRDWGYAPEYVEAMWLMVNAEEPADYVIATGEAWSVRDFCEVAFGLVGLDWREHVVQDKRYFRPKDVPTLIGDPTLARERLSWKHEIDFRSLVQIMLQFDLRNEGLDPRDHIVKEFLPLQPSWASRP